MTMAERGDAELTNAEFLDLRFDTVDEAQAMAMIAARPPNAPFAYVVTPNVDHVVRLHLHRSDLWPVYRRAWLTLCDSRILAGLARQVGLRLPVVPGSDLTQHMVGHAIAPGDRIAVIHFGSRAEVLVPAGDAEPLARVGQRVRAGITPLARYTGGDPVS